MHKILQNHLLCTFVANLKIDAIYALYTESFCDKNLVIRKVFAFCDSVVDKKPQVTQRRSQKKTRTTFEHQQLRMSNIDWLIRLVIRKWQGIMFVKICWHRSLKHVTKGSAQNPNYIECRGTYHAQSSFNCSYSRLHKLLVATHITNINGINVLGRCSNNQNGNLRWIFPWRGGVSSSTYVFWRKKIQKLFRIIPWLWKRVLHLVWALYYSSWGDYDTPQNAQNGTSGARIKILRTLFNTNTPPKTPI